MLRLDLDAERFALLLQKLPHSSELDLAARHISDHDHIEKAVHDILVDTQNVNAVFSQKRADCRDDAHTVLADDRNHDFHLQPLILSDNAICTAAVFCLKCYVFSLYQSNAENPRGRVSQIVFCIRFRYNERSIS